MVSFAIMNIKSSRLQSYLGHLFSPSSKNKKNAEKISYVFPKKVFLIFWEMELSSTKLKKLFIFLQKNFFSPSSKNKKTIHSENFFYVFPPKLFHIFLAPKLKTFLYFYQKRKSQIFLNFSKWNFLASNIKSFSYFFGNKCFLIFQEGTF